MTFGFWTNLIEGQPELSLLVWSGLLMLLMYIARQPAHQLILVLMRSLRNTLRLMARAVMLAEIQLRKRNREVLLAHGKDQAERLVERELQRVETQVYRDLSGFPALQRDLNEQITRIDEDYVQSAEIPPKPPEWLKAVEAVAVIPDNGSSVVAKILSDIHNTLKKSLDNEVHEYRRANRERHSLLKKMMPYWRSLTSNLDVVEKNISDLQQRSIIIDQQMQNFDDIRQQTSQAESMLTRSAMTKFVISGLALSLAIIGMYVNFHLVALPMEEMVGASSYLGSSSIKASEVATLFIIGIEVLLGLLLMETIGVTRLFPAISLLDEHKKKTIFWVMLGLLLVFASIEASLAYMRDFLAADRQALAQLLLGAEVAEPPLRWIPAIGQMMMGFALPVFLTFVAIPLESFIHSLRTIMGLLIVWMLHMLVVLIRLLANIIHNLGKVLIKIYDLIIIIPVKIENSFKQSTKKNAEHSTSGVLLNQQKDI